MASDAHATICMYKLYLMECAQYLWNFTRAFARPRKAIRPELGSGSGYAKLLVMGLPPYNTMDTAGNTTGTAGIVAGLSRAKSHMLSTMQGSLHFALNESYILWHQITHHDFQIVKICIVKTCDLGVLNFDDHL